MEASVVIPSYNRCQLLKVNLGAVFTAAERCGQSVEIIVVDNNSNDKTEEVVRLSAKRTNFMVRYLFEPRQGRSYALNAGIEQSCGRNILFTDDDVMPDQDWISRSLEALSQWNAAGVGGRILPKWSHTPPRWLTRSQRLRHYLALMEFNEPRELTLPVHGVPQIWGCNMAFRRSVFEDIGKFDTTKGRKGSKLYSGEDQEFVSRALQHGYKVVYDPTIAVSHCIGEDRMTKSYFRRWALQSGEGEWSAALPLGVRLLGAPRWQYRRVLAVMARWLGHAAMRRSDSIERELDFLQEFGRLLGAWKRDKSSDITQR